MWHRRDYSRYRKGGGAGGPCVGFDRDEELLGLARQQHGALANLQFTGGDATLLSYRAEFDIVTAARTLQWIAEPGQVISRMAEALRTGGRLVALDYNHTQNHWEPQPPIEFQKFYAAFLAWRHANQWDNEMADHLPGLFLSAGMTQVESHVQDEIAGHGEAQSALWLEVMRSLGSQFCAEPELRQAEACYERWLTTGFVRQTLAMRTVIGIRAAT